MKMTNMCSSFCPLFVVGIVVKLRNVKRYAWPGVQARPNDCTVWALTGQRDCDSNSPRYIDNTVLYDFRQFYVQTFLVSRWHKDPQTALLHAAIWADRLGWICFGIPSAVGIL